MISITLGDKVKSAIDQAKNTGGALDPDQVMIQFLCTTEGDGHDPDGTPDDRVRPSHAALHGSVWRLDDPSAPIPPLDYGCRCAIRYVSQPDTHAAEVLGEENVVDEKPEISNQKPYGQWLDDNVPNWKSIAQAASKAQPQERLNKAYLVAKKLGVADARAVAKMAVEASPYPMQPLGPMGTGPLSGVGKAGQVLVDRWRQGDLEAAAKLAKSYPATYARILAEGGPAGVKPLIVPPNPPIVPPKPDIVSPKPAIVPPKPSIVSPPTTTAREHADKAIADAEKISKGNDETRAALQKKIDALKDARNEAFKLSQKDSTNEVARAAWDQAMKAHLSALNEKDLLIAREREQIHQVLRVPEPTTAKLDASKASAGVKATLDKAWSFFRSVVSKGVIDDAPYRASFTRSLRANFMAGDVRLHKSSNVKTGVHEFAHGLEFFNSAVLNKAVAFRDSRTIGKPLVKLSKLTGEKGYRSNEVAVDGGFPKAYCGKVYSDGRATEIVSMGAEFLYDDPGEFMRKDPQYFRFMVELLRGL